jgi:hypothetical protein
MTDHLMAPISTTMVLRPDNTLLTRPNIAASPWPRSPVNQSGRWGVLDVTVGGGWMRR